MKAQDSKQFWDAFSTIFVENMGIKTSQVQLTLLSMLNWKKSQAIFDAGCGCGYLFPQIVHEKDKNTKFFAMDLASKMVESAALNLQSKLNSNFEQKDNFYRFPDLNVELQVGNVEDLSSIQNSSYDVYYSNLTLQLVENPEKMLQEAHRILKDNGQIACSVWGRRENNDFHEFMPKILQELKIEEPQPKRSNFHLNEKEVLIKLFESCAFTDILCWYQLVPYHFQTAKELIQFMMNRPGTSKLAESWTDQEKMKIMQRMEEDINQKWKVKKEPYFFEALMISAKK